MVYLIIATRNAHKVQEIRSILGESYQYLTLLDWPQAPLIVEDGETFAANAQKKALTLATWIARSRPSVLSTRLPIHGLDDAGFVFADDSGLEVDNLNGAPGIHSARFAALDNDASVNAPDTANNAKLLRLLKSVPLEQRTARFRCVIALAPIEISHVQRGETGAISHALTATVSLFEGVCEGRIGECPLGQGGFGYDPLFIPQGYSQTLAELGPEVKNQISHRARALAQLAKYLQIHKL